MKLLAHSFPINKNKRKAFRISRYGNNSTVNSTATVSSSIALLFTNVVLLIYFL